MKKLFSNLLGRHIHIDIVTVGVYEILPKPPKKKEEKRRRRKLIVHTGRWIKNSFAPLSMLPIKYLLRNSFFHWACAQQHETIKSLRQAWQCGYTKSCFYCICDFFSLFLVIKKKFSFNAETNSVLFCIDDDWGEDRRIKKSGESL